MKQACSLESMVDAVLSEMKRRGNAKNTIERHERAYSQFYEYALTQGENSYSKVLARSFLEEKEKLSAYRGPRFMEQYRIALNKLDDIAKGQDIRLRHLENGYHLKSSCFDWVIPFFEERLKRRLKNTYDVRTRLRILSLFLSFIETQNAKKLEDISINHIAAAFEASTDQNHFRSTIREFLSFAAEHGWMPTNLSCFVPKIRRHRGVPTVYSTDDIETCLASIDRTTQSGKRTYAVLLICARLGLRNTDACELKFSDIDWVKKTISIVQMKTGIPLVLPLLPEIEDAINRYIAARPQSDLSFIFLRHKAPYYHSIAHPFPNSEDFFFYNHKKQPLSTLTPYIWLRRALEIAGIDRHPYPKQLRGVCVHCLRHTFAVHTLQLQSKRGIDRFYSVPILSTYMGHTDIYGTELYLRLTPECYEHIVDCAEKDTGDIFPEVLP